MKSSKDYYDFETKKVKNLLDEIVRLSIKAKIEQGVDDVAVGEGEMGYIRQYMPIYIAKIVMTGVYDNPLAPENKIKRYRDELEKILGSEGPEAKIRTLVQVADENVACATIILPSEHNSRVHGLTDKEMLYWARIDYRRASSLKKDVRHDITVGEKLAYISRNLISYVPLIKSVFDIFKRTQESTCDENVQKEIDKLVSDESSIPLQFKKDFYCGIRKRYVNNEDRQMDLIKRKELKDRVREIYQMIKKEDPKFRDPLFEKE